MNLRLALLFFPVYLGASTYLQADCLAGSEVAENADVALFAQTHYVHKQNSLWQIDGQNPFAANNIYNDLGVKFSSGCSLIDNTLDLHFSLYGLTYYPTRQVGKFEEDNSRSRALIDQLQVTYSVTGNIQLEGGKIRARPGLFFLRSPASLLSSYYGGFKPTRFYDPAMQAAYAETFWGGRLSQEGGDYALGITVVPELARIDKRYISSGNWSASQRANSAERYLLSYTDYRLENHAPSVNVLLGATRSVAFSDSYTYTPQFVMSAELALHTSQQWRHFSAEKAAEVMDWEFPSSLYERRDKKGIELAIGGQYTSERFSVVGLEYYFQSEGYSQSAWRQQTDFVKKLNTPTHYDFLDRAFDSYKYLMGAEINNTGNQGMLQGKHYVNVYSSFQMRHGAKLQPYLTVNMMDGSAMPGVHFSSVLERIDQKLEMYTGAYTALGSQDSEFAIFGETLGIYLGFKYHL